MMLVAIEVTLWYCYCPDTKEKETGRRLSVSTGQSGCAHYI